MRVNEQREGSAVDDSQTISPSSLQRSSPSEMPFPSRRALRLQRERASERAAPHAALPTRRALREMEKRAEAAVSAPSPVAGQVKVATEALEVHASEQLGTVVADAVVADAVVDGSSSADQITGVAADVEHEVVAQVTEPSQSAVVEQSVANTSSFVGISSGSKTVQLDDVATLSEPQQSPRSMKVSAQSAAADSRRRQVRESRRPERRRVRATEMDVKTRSYLREQAAKNAKDIRVRFAQSAAVMGIATGMFATAAIPSYAVDPVVAATVDFAAVDNGELLEKQQEAEDAAQREVEQQELEFAAGESGDAEDLLARDDATASAPVATSRTTRQACAVSDPTGADVSSEVVMPLPNGAYTISSRMGPRWGRWHNGDDFSAARGTSIVAVAAGTVRATGYMGSNPYVEILHEMSDGARYATVYVHMPTSSISVQVGDRVVAGQQIAVVGNEGNSTGPHLHFEVHREVNGVVGEAADRATAISTITWLQDYQAAVTPGC